MADRLDLHNKFIEILGTQGEQESRVYFESPESVKMKYPAIRYQRQPIDNIYGSDGVYRQSQGYQVIVIDEDPEGVIAKKVSKLPTCRATSHYTSDNLHHDVFTLYH